MIRWPWKRDVPRDPNPDEELRHARAALAQGQFVHAAAHVAGALAANPHHTDARTFLERLSDVSPEPLALAPLGEQNYFGTVAVRAYLCARLQRYTEALDLLLDVAPHRPDIPYLDWACEWLESEEARGRVQPEPLVHFLMSQSDLLPNLPNMKPEWRMMAERFPRLIRAAQAASIASPMLVFASASVLRRMGLTDEALALVRSRQEQGPDPWCSSALGALLVQKGDYTGARLAYQEAVDLNPADVAFCLDLADANWRLDRLAEAAAQYTEALRLEPEHPWAAASLLGVRFQETRDPAWLEQLVRRSEAFPDEPYAQGILHRFQHQLEPYFGSYLPDPCDATVNAAREVRLHPPHTEPSADGPDGPGADGSGSDAPETGFLEQFALMLGFPEAPSAFLALAQQLHLLELRGVPTLRVQRIPSPDPRRPRTRVEHRLWRFKGVVPAPAIPPGADLAVEQLSSLAAQPYSFSGWREAARPAAAALRHLRDEQILGVLVHPPMPPEGMTPWRWIYRLDLAAAFVITHLDAGWVGSRRRSLLLSLANGPMDWTTNAALVALTAVALDNPELEVEIHHLFLDLLKHAPNDAASCYLDVLPWCALHLPNLPEEMRESWTSLVENPLEE